MKTKVEILSFQGGENCSAIDGRDRVRLSVFFDPSDWAKLGLKPSPDADLSQYQVTEYTEANVLKALAKDLDFAFQKALGKRGISSSLMWDVIKMWMWVLEDELADFPDHGYAQYGLPLYRAVAIKYNLPNPIGDDLGDEDKYASD